MPKKSSHLNKIKIKPTGPLADMIGSKALPRPQVTKKIWAYIDKHELKGESGDGQTVKYKTKNVSVFYVLNNLYKCNFCLCMF